MPTSSRCWFVVVVTLRADVGIRPYGGWLLALLVGSVVCFAVGVFRRRLVAFLLMGFVVGWL